MNSYQISSLLNGEGLRKNQHAINKVKARTVFGAKRKVKKIYKEKYSNCKIQIKSIKKIG